VFCFGGDRHTGAAEPCGDRFGVLGVDAAFAAVTRNDKISAALLLLLLWWRRTSTTVTTRFTTPGFSPNPLQPYVPLVTGPTGQVYSPATDPLTGQPYNPLLDPTNPAYDPAFDTRFTGVCDLYGCHSWEEIEQERQAWLYRQAGLV